MKKIFIVLVMLFIFNLNAKASYIVVNGDTKEIYEGSNIHEKRLIASITKVMTAYIVIENTNLDGLITIGDEINEAHGSSVYLKKGEIISVKDLLYGMMLRSGNDAALTLANYTSGSINNFVNLMNEKAKELGMKDTTFENPTGLDDNNTKNISSAYDMAILTSAAMKNKIFRKIFKTKKYEVKTNLNTYIWHNKNKALYMNKYINGGKTGYTKKSKRTLITSSSYNNVNTIVVSLNINDDFDFHINKHKSIYENYQKYLIINKNNLSVDDHYYKRKYNASFYIKNNYYIYAKKSNLKDIRIIYELYKSKKIKSNSVIGTAKIYKNNKLQDEIPVYIKISERKYYK